MLFNQDVQILYVDTDTPPVTTDTMLDIILSPVYYWVKRQSLPVRYLREAKKLLPSLFEETLPPGEYSYTAYKEGEHYLLFAYSDRAILDALAAKGIKPSQVRKVRFAQSEFSEEELPLQVDGKSALAIREGVVVKLPLAFVGESASLELRERRLSSRDVDLARYAHIADRRSVVRFASFIALLTLLVALEWGIVSNKTEALEQRRSTLFGEYHLKSTAMQNEAIQKRLEQRYSEQSALRDATAALLTLKLEKNERMTRYAFKETALKASFDIPDARRAEALASQLKRSGVKAAHTYAGGKLELEVRL